MTAEAKKPSFQAILVMDSRRTSLAVRSQNFAGAWTQLYKVGEFYLDLSLRPEAAGMALHGHIVADPSRQRALSGEVLHHRGGGVPACQPISEGGSFRLSLEAGASHQIELRLGGETYTVGGFTA